MPWKSDAQRRWGHSPSGEKAIGKDSVHEWDEAGKEMPEKVGLGHARKREKMTEKTKKMWSGGNC